MLGFIKKVFGSPSADFRNLVKQGALIVDVRTPAEFRAGHLEGSKNIPLDSLGERINDLKKMNKPIITVCRSGARSSVAKGLLKNAGLEVYNGGAWISLKNKVA